MQKDIIFRMSPSQEREKIAKRLDNNEYIQFATTSTTIGSLAFGLFDGFVRLCEHFNLESPFAALEDKQAFGKLLTDVPLIQDYAVLGSVSLAFLSLLSLGVAKLHHRNLQKRLGKLT